MMGDFSFMFGVVLAVHARLLQPTIDTRYHIYVCHALNQSASADYYRMIACESGGRHT